jgi:small-conductance mechanosensitive channel
MQEEVKEKIAEVVKVDIWGSIKSFLNYGFHWGEGDDKIHITIGLLLLVMATFMLTSYILVWIRKIYTRKMTETDTRKFVSVFKFIKYIVYVIVVFTVLSLAGVNVTPVLAASAALLVGVGLALQEVFQDVLAGIFIIVDKSLLVGDVIEVDGKVGRVIDIKLRTTRAVTRDDKVLIIPNHTFITNTVFNYTQNHKQTREFVTVGVAYGSDTQLVRDLLIQSLENDNRILKRPKPFVLFEDFGDSALVFSIYFFISDSFIDPAIKSDIRFRIDTLFRENKVTIPFPQRDVHFYPSEKQS